MVGRHALSAVEAQFYIANVLLGLQHIHSQDFVYRDLKPEVPHVPLGNPFPLILVAAEFGV